MVVADPELVAAVRLGGVLSCTSAARCHGLPVLIDRGPHVTVGRSWGHARLRLATVHRRDLDSCEHDGISTTLARTALDCARELPLREAVAICDAALSRGLDAGWLAGVAAAASGPGSRALRRVVGASDVRAESPLESCLRLLAGGLGELVLQVLIGGVGRVDMVLDGWLVLEADGFEFHSGRARYRDDRRRANALAEAGYVLLRFSYEDIVHHPERVVRTIDAVLARRAA